MNDEFNPYAAPKAEIGMGPREVGVSGFWRDGSTLVLSKDAALPDRCLKCNEPADGWALRRTLSWHPPGYYLIVLFNLLIYIIVAMIVRKTAKLQLPLCAAHRRGRVRAIAIAWLIGLAGIGVMIGGAALSSSFQGSTSDYITFGGFLTGLVMIVGALILGSSKGQVVSARKIDKYYVWLNKVDPRFLASLPPWSG